MNFDCIIANPPYGKIGVDVTKNVIKQNPDSNYAMLGTRSMFKPFYADTLACQFVQIGRYELGSNVKLDWGVEQAILLATNGWTEVVDNRKKEGGNKVGVNHIWLDHTDCMGQTRNAHLVQLPRSDIACVAATHSRSVQLVGTPVSIERVAWNHRARNAHLVQMSQGQIPQEAYTRLRNATLVTDKDDQHLRSGYLYVAFETFEEACECAIDIISWNNPTDSHYRCVRWGFVQELIAHERG